MTNSSYNFKNQDKKFEEVEKSIQVIERQDLELISEYQPEISTGPDWYRDEFKFIRINAIARSIPTKKIEVERYMIEDVISGLYGSKTPFVYLILGSKLQINVYLGILAKRASKKIESLITSLHSTFPNIEIEILNKNTSESMIFQFFQKSDHFGIMTGIPTPKFGIEEYGMEQIERLLRGLYRQEFGYMVVSDPIDDQDVIKGFRDISNEIQGFSRLVKVSSQFTKTTRETLSTEELNKQVQNYIELLEITLDKLKIGKSSGLWRTATYFFSPNSDTAEQMKTLLKVVFCGEKSVPETIRTFSLSGKYTKDIIDQFGQIKTELDYDVLQSGVSHPLNRLMKYKLLTILNSRDLATLTHLPKEEMPGYDVKDTARFGVCLPKSQKGGTLINIGEVLDRGLKTGNLCSIEIDELKKHGLIVGVTGSGKTNSCFYILNQLWNGPSRVPFLVIEPAKKEYRSLMRVKGFGNLHVFTLGNENVSQFRLNPFEFFEGITVQSHIDHLRAIFNASFIMYSPMPYVLERCIHEVYQDKGWNLITNTNSYIQPDEEYTESIFPTLSDLYEKIDTVVAGLGYEERITMDVKAALKTRIGSLLIGGKGAMLDTRLSIPMELLLSKPTILELESIGDDEEKAFIIALLVNMLYEYRVAEKLKNFPEEGLSHVTLIEEAHRLLTKTAPESGTLEAVNTKAKAVESFCNILSEIRAYNEGILIAEQIPTKLAEDAIKNTNLKLMHRIVAKDDRDILGHTMNLTEDQNKYVSIIEKGLGVIFFEGLHEPFLVKIPYFPEAVEFKTSEKGKITSPTDKEVKTAMSQLNAELDIIYAKQKGCISCQNKCKYLDLVKQILNYDEIEFTFFKYVLSIVENKDNITKKYGILKEAVINSIPDISLSPESIDALMFCFLITAGNRYFRLRKKQYNLSNQKINFLADSYFELINEWFAVKIRSQLSAEAEIKAEGFCSQYLRTFKLGEGPFLGCDEFCSYRCYFRFDVKSIVEKPSIINSLKDLVESRLDIKAKRKNVRSYCLRVGEGLTQGESPKFIENIGLCFFIQISNKWAVRNIISDIRKWFFVNIE